MERPTKVIIRYRNESNETCIWEDTFSPSIQVCLVYTKRWLIVRATPIGRQGSPVYEHAWPRTCVLEACKFQPKDRTNDI